MSKRIDKKKLKRQNEAAVNSVQSVPAQAPVKEDCGQVDFFIQYQDQEYLETEIVSRVRESCLLNGASSDELNTISIYLKPEDKKAYFTYGENKSGFIEL